MSRRALIVGVDHYERSPLNGCVNDARKIAKVLRTHEDNNPNFDCGEMLSMSTTINTANLNRKLEQLFKFEADVALFYFAGHGSQKADGWHLVTQDGEHSNSGVPFSTLLTYINQSPVKEKIVILDCCFSGGIGEMALFGDVAHLPKGVSILASSGSHQTSAEQEGAGLFTSIICEGLDGAAADILGQVSVAGLYNFASMLLRPWQQRPQFKANLSRVISIRKCQDKIDRAILRKLTSYFDHPKMSYPLSPEYEPDLAPSNSEKESILAEFRELAKVNLLVPVGEKYFYYACLNNKACQLTAAGKMYWKMAANNRI